MHGNMIILCNENCEINYPINILMEFNEIYINIMFPHAEWNKTYK